MELGKLDIKNFFLLVIISLLAYLMIVIFSPFINVLVIALVLVQIFYPAYKFISKKLNSEALASLVSTVLAIAVVVVPIILVIIFAISELNTLLIGSGDNTINLVEIENGLTTQIDNLLSSLEDSGIDAYSLFGVERNEFGEPEIAVTESLNGIISNMIEGLGTLAGGIIQTTTSALFYAVMLIMSLLYLFHDYSKLPELIRTISPLDDGLDKVLFEKITDTTRAVILGNFVVAFVQATAVILPMLLLGIPAPILLWIIMVLFSLIPVGSGVVWIPVAIALIANGNPVAGIFLIIYGAVMINVIEATLRPFLLKDSIQLHPLAIMFSALGGIAVFGPLGILYGPLVAVLFTSLMTVYTSLYSAQKGDKITLNEEEK